MKRMMKSGMIRLQKIMAALTAFAVATTLPTVPAAADNQEETQALLSGLVWSEDCVGGWELEWAAGSAFDTLLGARRDEYDIQYSYDVDGNRISKTVNGVQTFFTYDEYGFLLTEATNDTTIEYAYGYDENFDYILIGFTYCGAEYEYGYADGKIAEILFDGDPVAKYQYYYDICESVLGRTADGDWEDRSADPAFIGNINRIRLKKSYCDVETGWYCCGRYYSPELNRFIDGISEEKARELKEEHPEYPDYKIDSQIYTNGVNLRPVKGRAVQLSQEETVRRVIMLESPENEMDQDCVAWVIRNRQRSKEYGFENVNTVYGVVTQPGQFSVLNKPEFENFSEYASKPLWEHTYKLYAFLMAGAPYISKPYGYTDQLYFSSIKTFMAYKRVEGGTFYYTSPNGQINTYTDCWCIPVGKVTNANVTRLTLTQYWGVYNVFCDKHFNV